MKINIKTGDCCYLCKNENDIILLLTMPHQNNIEFIWELCIYGGVERPNKNKRLMGNIAHLRKQFKSINTYDYIITLIKRRKKINFMRIYGPFF